MLGSSIHIISQGASDFFFGFYLFIYLYSSPPLALQVLTLRQQWDLEASSQTSAVWGAAYHIPPSHAREVHAYLDDREIDGYTVHYTPFHPSTAPAGTARNSLPGEPAISQILQPMICMVYIGLPTNSQFLRNPSLRDPTSVAQVISISCGKSGENREYLYLLEKALQGLGLGSADRHVTDLVRRVKSLESRQLRDGGETGRGSSAEEVTRSG
jgi:cation transport regulator ChaC